MPWFTKQRNKKARNTLLCLWGQNFDCSGEFQGQYWPVLAISGLFQPYWSPTDTTRCGPIMAESAQFGANPRKKKYSNAALTCRQPHWTLRPTLDSGAASSQPHPCFLDNQPQIILQHFYKIVNVTHFYWFSSKSKTNVVFLLTNNHSLHQ